MTATYSKQTLKNVRQAVCLIIRSELHSMDFNLHRGNANFENSAILNGHYLCSLSK